MPFEKFKTLLHDIPSAKRILLQGQGEPLLNKDLIKMIHCAKDKGLVVDTCTNGVLVSQDVAQRLLDSGLDKIAFSVDSCYEEKYEVIQRGAKFRNTLGNIESFVQLRNRQQCKTIICLYMVIMKNNVQEIPDYLEFGANLGVDRVTLQRLISIRPFLDRYCPSVINQLVSVNEMPPFDSLYSLSRRLGIDLTIDENKACQWLRSSAYITWNGYLTPCCLLWQSEYFLGNVYDEGFEIVWLGRRTSDFRRALQKGQFPSVCKACRRAATDKISMKSGLEADTL